MKIRETRQRQVEWVLNVTRDTKLAPSAHELELLQQFVDGYLTLDQVIEILEGRSESSKSPFSKRRRW